MDYCILQTGLLVRDVLVVPAVGTVEGNSMHSFSTESWQTRSTPEQREVPFVER